MIIDIPPSLIDHPTALHLYAFLLRDAHPKTRVYETSIRSLAKRLKTSVQRIRSAIDILEGSVLITHSATHLGSIITICDSDICDTLKNGVQLCWQHTKEKERKQEKETFPPIPPYKEKEINKEKEISNNIGAGENFEKLDEEIAAIGNDSIWLDQLQLLHHVSVSSISQFLPLFRAQCIASGVSFHPSIAETKRHFSNWLRIFLKNESNNTTTRQQRMSEAANLCWNLLSEPDDGDSQTPPF